MSVHRRASDAETGLSETNDTTVHTQDPPTDTSTKRQWLDWNDTWAWEIGSVTLAVVGLALLVAFLVTINNTPYANWQYTASPNTVVSIIVTITKAALLVPVSSCLGQLKWNLFQDPAPLYHMQVIDQASRGPWGSLEILLGGIFGSRTGSLTYIGAVITILALAVDPFAQQILTLPSRTVPALNATALTQTSQNWTSTGGLDQSDVHLELPPTLFTAIISGLMQTQRPLEPQCNALSCDFPEFVALGMCSKCEDVTARTDQKCQVEDDLAFWEGIPVHPALREAPTNCSYRTPSNFSFDFKHPQSIAYGTIGVDSDLHKSNNVTFNMNHWSLRPRADYPILGIQAPIVSLIEVDYIDPVRYIVSNATAPPTKPVITECAVYFCERRYAAGTFRPTTQDSSPLHVVDTQELIVKDAQEERPDIYSPDPFYFDPPKGSATLSKNPTYSMDHLTFNSFRPLMMSLFNSTNNGNRFNVSISDTLKLASFLRRGNLGEILDSMSTSVTDTIRKNGHGSEVSGKAFRDERFIQVRWPWIILPVVVALGSLALLLGTAIGSKQTDAVLWKCMVLPLLSSDLHTTPEHRIASVRSADGMTAMSKNMRAVVVQDEGPLTFKEK
ncbi:hypothetical protein P168DRAFT_308339 [Aspergillus campestris IBT 28561]|uniref:Uncharacterized protein n=1 Tax=Aspergillus campestris (strain IBT 28561) TaxID=1392248 RepID=A0A2I1DEE3_ASPC2|nr:uncharacterized protein P168DRAFT_308339 [Aspergillus campestris IBT 28561]PKY08257.1 hypothetical protein P168DRAFT_308339 [Aspergillus campestris IBT 28561]